MIKRAQVSSVLVILNIFLGAVVSCAPRVSPPTTTPTEPPSPTLAELPAPASEQPPAATAALPSDWVTRSASADKGQCGYAISHPSNMEGTSEGMYSWSLFHISTEPSGPYPNFVYISVIPDNFQSNEPGTIYNYDPAESQTLLNMQVGESRSLREDANIAPAFTYTRLPDTTLSSQAAQTYENTQPWEFPPGTKEIRYYLKANGCTYLVGGYISTTDQPGAIDQELFNQILATFRLAG